MASTFACNWLSGQKQHLLHCFSLSFKILWCKTKIRCIIYRLFVLLKSWRFIIVPPDNGWPDLNCFFCLTKKGQKSKKMKNVHQLLKRRQSSLKRWKMSANCLKRSQKAKKWKMCTNCLKEEARSPKCPPIIHFSSMTLVSPAFIWPLIRHGFFSHRSDEQRPVSSTGNLHKAHWYKLGHVFERVLSLFFKWSVLFTRLNFKCAPASQASDLINDFPRANEVIC